MGRAGKALMAASPPRPRQEKWNIVWVRPDQRSQKMTHFHSGYREESSFLRRGLGSLRNLFLSTDSRQECLSQHRERDKSVPRGPGSDFIVIHSTVFARFKSGKRPGLRVSKNTNLSPSSREALLPPSPLRTVQASFPAYRSSLSNAP